MQAERVRLQRLAQRLLEGLLLELQHQPVGLLPLSLSLLRSLSPGWMEERGEQRKLSVFVGTYIRLTNTTAMNVQCNVKKDYI